MKTAFIYSDEFTRFDYGVSHPLKVVRLKLTYELIKACGLLSSPDAPLVEPPPATDEDLLSCHTQDYLDMLKAVNSGKMVRGAEVFGLGPGDNPVFPGLYEGSLLAAGASLTAARLVDSAAADRAFNIAGGLHHAMASYASGFCYVNDPVIAIKWLVARGRRVCYIDIDAHHADGVQAAFYDTDRVLTISLHETGEALFPGTGFEPELGTGQGEGYSVNVPLPPESGDEIFLYAFDKVVSPLVEAFKPDIVVSQLGVDGFWNDPLAHLRYTTNGFCEAVRKIKTLSPKWVALGGGGYDVANVARAWTLAWAIMNDSEAPEDIPEDFLKMFSRYGFPGKKLRDRPLFDRDPDHKKKETGRVIEYIKRHSFLGK